MYSIDREEEDLGSYDKVVTLEELSKEAEKEHASMSDNEKYCRMRDGDPTFIEYCCSFMSCNNLDKALINEFTYKCERLNDNPDWDKLKNKGLDNKLTEW